jgi:hypothetical protein
MKKLALALLIAASAFAADAPKPPKTAPIGDKILADYWHAIAAHYAQAAVLSKVDQELDGIRHAMCPAKFSLDESGPNPNCIETPAPKK